MTDNWYLNEIDLLGKIEKNQDIVILENPIIKSNLLKIQLKYWEFIHLCLKNTGLHFSPESQPPFSRKPLNELEYFFEYMLFNNDLPFFRGRFSCSKHTWFLESDFNISFSIENDPQIIHEILGNTRLVGNPPTLTVNKYDLDNYYHIFFRNGSGAGWMLDTEDEIKSKICKNIDCHAALMDYYKKSTISETDFPHFMSLIYEVYEAY